MRLFCLIALLSAATAFPTEFPIDPELTLDFVGIAARWNYYVETHQVVTDDGYILTVHRLPYKQFENSTTATGPRPVVFIQHGLEGSSASWVLNLPDQSAGFVFAEAGYDVWLGNYRGNEYSKNHTFLDPKSHAFWDFSWDQMASQDLPAMINYVCQQTNQKQLYYIGFSMGTLTAFAEFSRNHELEKQVRQFFAMGPVASVAHIQGLFRWMADRYEVIDAILEITGSDEFLPPDYFTHTVAEDVCEDKETYELCDNIVFLISGKESGQLNETRVPIYINHTPAGTSSKTMVHFAQNVHYARFQMWDYGTKRLNNKHYGMDQPPEYKVEDITVPTRLYWGFNDTCADPTDVNGYLIPRLKSMISQQGFDGFSHVDFNWGLKAAPEVYQPIMQIIQEDFKKMINGN